MGFSSALPDWSISLEMQFYAIFPLIYNFMVKIQSAVYIIIISVIIYIVGIYYKGHVFIEPSFLPIKINVFMVGVLVGLSAIFRKQKKNYLSIVSVAACLLLALSNSLYTLIFSVLMMIAILSTGKIKTIFLPFDWFFSITLSQFMGKQSYCVYLFHAFYIYIFAQLFKIQWYIKLNYSFQVFIFCLAVVTLTYITSTVLHLAVEKPGIELGGKLIKSLRSQRVDVEASDNI